MRTDIHPKGYAMNIYPRNTPRCCCTLFIILILLLSPPVQARNKTIIIYSAGSTTNAIIDIAELFSKQQGVRTITSFASSSTLARQIDNGAPAHIYLSANKQWMDYLDNKGLVEPETRFNLLKNRIVMIAPMDSPLNRITIEMNCPLSQLIGDGHLAMGDPDHVPSGIYGREALENLGVWHTIRPKVVRTKDVRSALVLVSRGEVPMGQVYSTDAAISNQVKTIGIFPLKSHSPIVYPVAALAGKNTPETLQFLSFLKTEPADRIFKQYGFTPWREIQ